MELYTNEIFDSLQKRVEKDYLFSMHKLSFERGVAISEENIRALDDVSEIEKPARPEALKSIFISLSKKGNS